MFSPPEMDSCTSLTAIKKNEGSLSETKYLKTSEIRQNSQWYDKCCLCVFCHLTEPAILSSKLKCLCENYAINLYSLLKVWNDGEAGSSHSGFYSFEQKPTVLHCRTWHIQPPHTGKWREPNGREISPVPFWTCWHCCIDPRYYWGFKAWRIKKK